MKSESMLCYESMQIDRLGHTHDKIIIVHYGKHISKFTNYNDHDITPTYYNVHRWLEFYVGRLCRICLHLYS